MRISDWSSDVCSSDLLQNILFEAFEGLLVNRIKAAVAAGTYEIGLETLRAESFAVKAWQTIYTHPGRQEERRVGKECVMTGKSRWSPLHSTHQHTTLYDTNHQHSTIINTKKKP